jgi:putative membrane protein
MVATWVLGLWLAFDGGFLKAGWLHGKLVLVLILSGIHGFLTRAVRDFAADRNVRSQRFYRVVNEVPAVLMVGIVILVIVKPF